MKVLMLSNDSVLPVLRPIVKDMKIDVTYNQDDEYDRGVSFMYLKKITKAQLIKTWINFHPAPLPKYKGRNLCYHAIMNGETKFGATVHYVDDNYDTGRIIETRMFSILPSDTSDTVSRLAMLASYDLLCDYLPRYANGEHFRSRPNVGGNYYRNEPISVFIDNPEVKRKVRAITFGNNIPRMNIGGVIFKIVKEECSRSQSCFKGERRRRPEGAGAQEVRTSPRPKQHPPAVGV